MRRYMNLGVLALMMILVAMAGAVFADTSTYDSPHNSYTGGVECGHCHIIRNETVPFWYSDPQVSNDDTLLNRMCNSCHNDVTAPMQSTHSSAAVGQNQWPGVYPTGWNVDCATCHWQYPHSGHSQKSITGSRLITGTTVTVGSVNAAANTTTLTLNPTGGEPGYQLDTKDWARYILFTNSGAKSWVIQSSAGLIVTVEGNASTATGDFFIVYGKFIGSNVDAGNTVHFFDTTGTHGFIDSSGDGGKGICEACHTQTQFFRKTGSYPHVNATISVPSTENCITCHSHKEGFKPSGGCNSCHGQSTTAGYPPTGTTEHAAGFESSANSHSIHVADAGGDNITTCNVCHNGHGMPSRDADVKIEFSGTKAGTLGQYDPPNNADYIGSVNNPANATLVCSNVNCHNDGYVNVPSPAWGSSPAQCSECHAVVPTTASHPAHTASQACNTCHVGAVQGTTAPTANHRNGTRAADGNCSTSTCHFTGFVATNPMPAWGSSPAQCSECHAVVPTTGSHTVHISGGANCGNCHVGAVQGTTAPTANHRNGTRQADGDCSTCHFDGFAATSPMPVWDTSPAQCSECHAAQPLTSSHNKHFSTTFASGANLPACGDCHDGAVQGSTAPTAGHRNSNREASTTLNGYVEATNACATADCHSDGKGNYTSVSWGQTSTGCTFCHGYPPVNGFHPVTAMPCNSCHTQVNGTNDGFTDNSTHINGVIEPPETNSCDGCHAYAASSWASASEMSVEGKGAHSQHITELQTPERRNIPTLDPTVGFSDGFGLGQNAAICGTCHTNVEANHGAGTRMINFGDGSNEFQFGPGLQPVYNGVPGTDSSVNPKNCSNISCHYTTTPLWSQPQ